MSKPDREQTITSAKDHATAYAGRLSKILLESDWSIIEPLAEALLDAWKNGRQVFWAGNGGSAGNAIHIVNDMLYPVSKRHGDGIRAHALPANSPVLTCLANDEGYEEIFAKQLAVLADEGDVLIVMSGSGNSPNILRVLEEAKAKGVTSFAILGYSGGKAKALADHPLHFPVDDMQIAEDLQLIIGHMVMQYLYQHR